MGNLRETLQERVNSRWKAWSRDSSNPFKKKQEQEGKGGRQLVSGEEGDARGGGGVELKEMVQG